MAYPAIAVTVDVAILTIRDDELCILLVRRGEAPYRGRWALPGGFVGPAEDLAEAAVRELAEETGIRGGFHLEQLQTYGAPRRDPRMRTVTVAYLALAPNLATPVAGTDAAHAAWLPVAEALRTPARLAFDRAANDTLWSELPEQHGTNVVGPAVDGATVLAVHPSLRAGADASSGYHRA